MSRGQSRFAFRRSRVQISTQIPVGLKIFIVFLGPRMKISDNTQERSPPPSYESFLIHETRITLTIDVIQYELLTLSLNKE